MDSETRRKKQQELMTELLDRKVRMHAQHLYDQRGQEDGHALQDWVQAEETVLENSILAPLYRRSKNQAASNHSASNQVESQDDEAFGGVVRPEFAPAESSTSDAS